MLDSNHDLCRRLDALEEGSIIRDCTCSIRTTIKDVDDTETIRPPDARPRMTDQSSSELSPFHFEFDSILQASRVYMRTHSSECDVSFKSSVARSRAWSLLSDITLEQISILSVIALPIYPSDISNRDWYEFGDLQEVNHSSTRQEEHNATDMARNETLKALESNSKSSSTDSAEFDAPDWQIERKEVYPCEFCRGILEEGKAFELGKS